MTLLPSTVNAIVNYALKLCVVLLLLFVFAGCKQAIYTRLTEQEANDVLLTLSKGGVEAEKRTADEKTFGVWVSESKIATAIEFLRAGAQPSEHYTNLGEVFGKDRLISSPTEERARFIYGVQQEIASTLSQIPGVLVARVHVVVPASDPLATESKPASASVFLKHRADMNMQVVVPKIKDLVVRSIEGLSADKVAVTLFPAPTALTSTEQMPVTNFFGTMVPSSSVPILSVIMGVPWIIVLFQLALLLRGDRLWRWASGLAKMRQSKAARERLAPNDGMDDRIEVARSSRMP